MTAPGWYLNPDPSNPGTERYWTGGAFTPGARVASPGTEAFPAVPEPIPPDPLEMVRRQLAAAERTANYLGWMLFLQVAIIATGVILFLAARNG
jgi:hypothetical protein